MFAASRKRWLRRPALIVVTLLAIEFLDEFIFGGREAAWPLIRDDLGLSYLQIGLLLSVPGLFASLIEPVLGILGDIWRRRFIMLSGGVGFAAACLLTAASENFLALMVTTLLFAPSSGAFVALAQSTLMDHDTERHEHNMARWTFAGSLGVVIGSLFVGLLVVFGMSWRVLPLVAFVLTVLCWFALWKTPLRSTMDGDEEDQLSFKDGVRNAIKALRRPEVMRWLLLLQFSDLMLDILYGYIALYFVDVLGTSAQEASLAVAAWTCVGLLGDFLLIPLLERVRGLSYLRISAAVEFFLFPAFLLVPGFWPKLIILAFMGFFNAGWYSILQGQLYTSMPGQSGTVLTLSNIVGVIHETMPLAIGAAAGTFGLGTALWLCLFGPVALLIGLPRHGTNKTVAELAEIAPD
jgi:MFS transporter, FSR family, fosmidomycin resistance protein